MVGGDDEAARRIVNKKSVILNRLNAKKLITKEK